MKGLITAAGLSARLQDLIELPNKVFFPYRIGEPFVLAGLPFLFQSPLRGDRKRAGVDRRCVFRRAFDHAV
jgi:hypothetical protein